MAERQNEIDFDLQGTVSRFATIQCSMKCIFGSKFKVSQLKTEKMTILISSNYFASKLSEFVENDEIENMTFLFINDNKMVLKSENKTVELFIENIGKKEFTIEVNRRKWSFLLENLKRIPDQPLCFDFFTHNVSMYFQF